MTETADAPARLSAASIGEPARTGNPPADSNSGQAPGFRWNWSLRYASGNLGAGLMFAFANAALPLYLAGYGLPNAAIGLLAQDRPPLAGLSQIVVGALSDRTHSKLGRRRPYLLIGVPVAATALLALAMHPPVWVAIGVLVLFTTALAVAYGPYLAMLPDLVPSAVRGRVGGLQAAANMLGQMSMLWVAAQFWTNHESRVFAIGAVGLVVAFGITFFGVSESSPPIDEPSNAPRFAPLEFFAVGRRRSNPCSTTWNSFRIVNSGASSSGEDYSRSVSRTFNGSPARCRRATLRRCQQDELTGQG
jgi:hypothetical protein